MRNKGVSRTPARPRYEQSGGGRTDGSGGWVGGGAEDPGRQAWRCERTGGSKGARSDAVGAGGPSGHLGWPHETKTTVLARIAEEPVTAHGSDRHMEGSVWPHPGGSENNGSLESEVGRCCPCRVFWSNPDFRFSSGLVRSSSCDGHVTPFFFFSFFFIVYFSMYSIVRCNVSLQVSATTTGSVHVCTSYGRCNCKYES